MKLYRKPGAEPIEETEPLIRQILEELAQVYLVDLRDDQELIRGLKYHIYTVILRRDRDLPLCVDEETTEDLKRQYPLAVELAAMAASRIGLTFHYTVPESEIPLIALHFQLALERHRTKQTQIRCCVVCHFGMAASSLIRFRMEKSYPELTIVSTCSYQEYCAMDTPDFDLILSTEQLPAKGIPIIYISLGQTRWEQEHIRHFVWEHRAGHKLRPLLEQAILLHPHSKTPVGIITELCEKLQEEGVTEDGFLNSVLQREQLSSTELESLALPHGDPRLVRETVLVVGRLDVPVRWNEEEVSTVFLLACAQQTMEKKDTMFSQFFRKLAEPSTEEAIRQLTRLPDEEYRQRLIYLMAE